MSERGNETTDPGAETVVRQWVHQTLKGLYDGRVRITGTTTLDDFGMSEENAALFVAAAEGTYGIQVQNWHEVAMYYGATPDRLHGTTEEETRIQYLSVAYLVDMVLAVMGGDEVPGVVLLSDLSTEEPDVDPWGVMTHEPPPIHEDEDEVPDVRRDDADNAAAESLTP